MITKKLSITFPLPKLSVASSEISSFIDPSIFFYYVDEEVKWGSGQKKGGGGSESVGVCD